MGDIVVGYAVPVVEDIVDTEKQGTSSQDSPFEEVLVAFVDSVALAFEDAHRKQTYLCIQRV